MTSSLSSPIKRATRKYDIVLWGATGFTGSLTAKYLASEYQNLKIAVAGRDSAKLKILISSDERFGNVDVVTASLDDPSSLRRMTESTQCLISTAGPFARIGVPVVDACVETSTNYVDITGEPQYVRKLIDSYHHEAIKKGIKIVPCCGFDCIPSDLGCQMMVEEMKSRGLEPKEVRLLVDKVKGGVSGGTVASIVNLIESSTFQELGDVGNPFCLSPRESETGRPMEPTDSTVVTKGSDNNVAGYDDVMKCYTMPYIMQGKGAPIIII